MVVPRIQRIIYLFFLCGNIYAQTTVTIVSEKVGAEIDIHENRFYRIFPNEKGFINHKYLLQVGMYNFNFTF